MEINCILSNIPLRERGKGFLKNYLFSCSIVTQQNMNTFVRTSSACGTADKPVTFPHIGTVNK